MSTVGKPSMWKMPKQQAALKTAQDKGFDLGSLALPLLFGGAFGYFLSPDERKFTNAIITGILTAAGTQLLKSMGFDIPSLIGREESDVSQVLKRGIPIASGIGGWFLPQALREQYLAKQVALPLARDELERYVLKDVMKSLQAQNQPAQRPTLDSIRQSLVAAAKGSNPAEQLKRMYETLDQLAQQHGLNKSITEWTPEEVAKMRRAAIEKRLKPISPWTSGASAVGAGALGAYVTPFITKLVDDLLEDKGK